MSLSTPHPHNPQAQSEGYKPLTTQIFDREDKYLDNDSVFAVKDSLIVDFVPRKGDSKAVLELEYPILLAPQGSVNVEGVTESTNATGI